MKKLPTLKSIESKDILRMNEKVIDLVDIEHGGYHIDKNGKRVENWLLKDRMVYSSKLNKLIKKWIKYAGNIDIPKHFGDKIITEHTDPFVAIEIALKHIFNLKKAD